MASAGVIRVIRQAKLKIMGMDSVMELPGLKSVASATGSPFSIIFRAGRYSLPPPPKAGFE